MLTITDLISQRPVLVELASYVSTIDLYHLALTSRTHRAHIQPSSIGFEVLRRRCLCDGRGLARRQNFTIPARDYVWGNTRKIWKDEPIEVRLYNTKCEVEALPCRKCGINLCEECRDYPREPPRAGYPRRRPHLNSPWQHENMMCLCDKCDAELEESLKGQFLHELCDCDIFTRWICHKCIRQERAWTSDYYRNHTIGEYGALDEEPHPFTKVMGDHQHSLSMYCTCGASVPESSQPRCTWCKRKHLPESEWYNEWTEIGCKMPFFEEDPCHAPYVGDIYNFRADSPYPTLAYKGPIWKVPGS